MVRVVRRKEPGKFRVSARVAPVEGDEGEEVEERVLVDTGSDIDLVTLRLVEELGWAVRRRRKGDPTCAVGFTQQQEEEVQLVELEHQ